MRRIILLGVLGVALAAAAGTLVDQGAPGTQGPWNVKCSNCITTINVDGGLTVNATGAVTLDGGFAFTLDRACSQIVSNATVIGATSTPVPATAATGRIWIEVCNTLENSGTTHIKCRGDDGGTVAFGITNVGDTLFTGDCHRYPLSATPAIECIANGVDSGIATNECIP